MEKILEKRFLKGLVLIPHDVLIAKIAKTSAYRFSMDLLVFMCSYLKKRKQNVKANNIKNLLKILVSGVP